MGQEKSNKKRLKQISITILKYIILPIITGIIVWAITKHFGDEKINGLNENIKSLGDTIFSLENKIKVQQDSLSHNTKYIESLELNLHNCTNNGVIIGRDAVNSKITN